MNTDIIQPTGTDAKNRKNRVREKRYQREKICPTSGSGYLPIGAQRRKAQQIIDASGINNETKIIEANLGTTFRQQAEWFIHDAKTRARKPVAASTLATWVSCIDKHLNPRIGGVLLSQLNNAVAKNLVASLLKAGLSDSSIFSYFGVVKMVVASTVNNNGEEKFPQTWNHEFIDLPIVDASKQHKPTFSSEAVTQLLQNINHDKLRMIIILAASSDMRIGEILGLNIENVSSDGTIVKVTDKAFRAKVQNFLKTKNGNRLVDLDPQVGKTLREFIGDRKGSVFASRHGQPLQQSNILRRQLHPLLKRVGLPVCGMHAFRRYRITWLRKKYAPEGLVQFCLGHAGKSITDGYDRVREDEEYRKEVARSVGLGFVIAPAVSVQRVQRNRSGVSKKLALTTSFT